MRVWVAEAGLSDGVRERVGGGVRAHAWVLHENMLSLLKRAVPKLLTHPGLSLGVAAAIVLQEQRPRLWFTVAADEMETARRRLGPTMPHDT